MWLPGVTNLQANPDLFSSVKLALNIITILFTEIPRINSRPKNGDLSEFVLQSPSDHSRGLGFHRHEYRVSINNRLTLIRRHAKK